MDQDKIDVARATPVTDGAAVSRPVARKGAPLWLQLLLSLIVIIAAAAIAGLVLPSANTMLRQVGVALPLLTGASDDSAAAPAAGGQGQRQGAQAQGQAQTGQRAGGQGAPGGNGQGAGAGNRPGGFGANRIAVVVAVPATTGIINNELGAIGESSALHSVTVNSASGGTLVAVYVKPGDHVNAGDKLAILDSDTQQNAYDRATLAARDAQATLVRTQSLAKTNAVPQTQLDAAQLAADNAKLALSAAQIALDQRTITTPIAGTVGIIQVTPGNLINAQTVVTTIEDSSEILINFWVPERYSSQISVGQAVTAQSAALPGKSFSGTISAVDNKIDPDSRTLQLQATLPNEDGQIKSGMSFSVDMTFPGETFPAVDPLAIQWSNQGAYVWKIADGKVHKGMVEIIQRNTDGVLVKGDVKPGDSIVTQGVLQLSEGATVRLLDAGAGAGGAAGATPGDGKQAGPLPPDAGVDAAAADAAGADAAGAALASPAAGAAELCRLL